MFLDINNFLDCVENGSEENFMFFYINGFSPIKVDLNKDKVFEDIDFINVACDSQSTENKCPKGDYSLGGIKYRIPKNSIDFIEFI